MEFNEFNPPPWDSRLLLTMDHNFCYFKRIFKPLLFFCTNRAPAWAPQAPGAQAPEAQPRNGDFAGVPGATTRFPAVDETLFSRHE